MKSYAEESLIDKDIDSTEDISLYIKQLEEHRDVLIKQQAYAKAKEYEQKIKVYKAKEHKQKTSTLKRIHSSELLELNDEFNVKHEALVKKWEAKVREMNSIISEKLNALSKKHNREKEAFNERGNETFMNNTISSSSFFKSTRSSFNRPPATYLNLKKKQEMIFKGKNRDYTLAEQLKKESEKILKEEANKKIIQLKKNTQKEYYKMLRRQEEEMNKLQYEIKSNVDLMNFMKEKEFELLKQAFKNKKNYISRSQRMEVLFSSKIESHKQKSSARRNNSCGPDQIQSVIIDRDNLLFKKYFLKSKEGFKGEEDGNKTQLYQNSFD